MEEHFIPGVWAARIISSHMHIEGPHTISSYTREHQFDIEINHETLWHVTSGLHSVGPDRLGAPGRH